MPGGKSAGASAGIGGINGGIGKTVEGHGRGAGGEHGDDDPQKLMSSGETGGREHGSAEREGKREDRVLPLDHIEGDAKALKNGHKKILMQVTRGGAFVLVRVSICCTGAMFPSLIFGFWFLCEKLAGTLK